MREIKVKVWDKKNKVMFPNKKYLVNCSMNLKGEWEIIREGVLGYKENEKQNDFIFIQFTGFKDINNVEIYDGDIVEYEDEHKVKQKGVVKYYDGDNGCKYRIEAIGGDDEGNQDIEIWKEHNIKKIGNINENPELMEIKNG